MPRLFVAALLPEHVKDALRAAGERLKKAYPAARLSARGNLHLTLLFLGETGEEDTERVKALLAALPNLPMEALRAVPAGLGRFAGLSGTVFWAGLQVNPALAAFRDSLASALLQSGFHMDGKAFVPHITLARHQGEAGGAFPPGPWPGEGAAFSFTGVCLMESTRRPEGPVYRGLMDLPTAGGA